MKVTRHSPFGLGILDKGKDEDVKMAISNEHLKNLTMKRETAKEENLGSRESRFVYLLICDLNRFNEGKIDILGKTILDGGTILCTSGHNIFLLWVLSTDTRSTHTTKLGQIPARRKEVDN